MILIPFQSKATDITCYLLNQCTHWRRTNTSANPSTGSQLKINPSAVPTEKGWGLEGIHYDNDTDLSFVRGNGRMGAAISPSNSEETFFGPPGFELSTDLWDRKYNKKKYTSNKLTLATAFNLIEKKGSGLNKYNLKLGLMAKYNKLSYNTTPGGGISGAMGPVSFGYSLYDDQTLLDYGAYSTPITELFKYRVQTYNVGLFLNSIALDYSNMRLETDDKSFISTINLFTMNLSLGRFVITAAQRREDSPIWAYNYETKQLEPKQFKEEYFGGIQYNFSTNIMLGVLYNYYLLREFSATATLFF